MDIVMNRVNFIEKELNFFWWYDVLVSCIMLIWSKTVVNWLLENQREISCLYNTNLTKSAIDKMLQTYNIYA